jgi:Concanavalin A-like lectin/glucanases superfamily
MTIAGIRRGRFRLVPLENHAPDPREATSPAEFAAQLRRLKAWSDLTYRELEKEAARRGHVLPHSTIATALKRDSLPRTELVAALVSACGCDDDTVALWVAARRRLSAGDGPVAPVADPPPAGPHRAAPPSPAGHRMPRRLTRPVRLAAVLLTGMLLIGASSHPTGGHRPHPAPATPATATPRPAAWWRFEEAGGSDAHDSSGHGIGAAISGDATRTAAPGGHALTLGSGGHAVATDPVVRTDQAFTITAWVRLDETRDWGTVVSEHHAAREPDVILLDYDAKHREWAFMMPDRRRGWAMGDDTVFSGLRPVRGRWTHLAAVHDPAGRRVCLYVDGALGACRTRASLVRADGPLDIGRALEDGEPVDGWHGAIDDVRVYAVALTDAQIGAVAGERA